MDNSIIYYISDLKTKLLDEINFLRTIEDIEKKLDIFNIVEIHSTFDEMKTHMENEMASVTNEYDANIKIENIKRVIDSYNKYIFLLKEKEDYEGLFNLLTQLPMRAYIMVKCTHL